MHSHGHVSTAEAVPHLSCPVPVSLPAFAARAQALPLGAPVAFSSGSEATAGPAACFPQKPVGRLPQGAGRHTGEQLPSWGPRSWPGPGARSDLSLWVTHCCPKAVLVLPFALAKPPVRWREVDSCVQSGWEGCDWSLFPVGAGVAPRSPVLEPRPHPTPSGCLCICGCHSTPTCGGSGPAASCPRRPLPGPLSEASGLLPGRWGWGDAPGMWVVCGALPGARPVPSHWEP